MAITIRSCTDADVAGVVALIEDRIGAEDAPEAQLVLDDANYERLRWSVAVDGDRVVSTMGTYPMVARFGIVEVPAAIVEFVATDRNYEGRGLVRRQFDYHHADLAQRGELLQVMVGITYFYRKLGYEYALPVAPWLTVLAAQAPSQPAGWSVREAVDADVRTVLDLQQTACSGADVSVALSPLMWSFLLQSPVYTTLLAEKDGKAEGCARIYLDDEDPFVMDLAATSREALAAVVAAVGSLHPDRDITFLTRPHAVPNLDDLGSQEHTGEAYYARIGDPVRWLNTVRPELSRRLTSSTLARAEGEGLISMYESSIRFSYRNGEVGEFRSGSGEPAPISKGGSGIPPDLITSLLVGPLGFSGLEDRHPDVNGGKQTELMETLFPAQTIDVQSWVVP